MAVATIRRRVFELMDSRHERTGFNKVFDIGLIALITLNVLAAIVESIPGVQQEYGAAFSGFEQVSVFLFTIEYIARVWSSVEREGVKSQHPVFGRLRYMLTPMAMLDLLVILPFYLTFLVSADLRFLRVMRLMRAFRLTRYSSSMNLLLRVLREEAPQIGAALFVLAMLIVLAASITYLAERAAQPEAFGSIPHALWWAVVTMTTIGYGDVYPITAIGRIAGSVIAIISVGMVALPAGILASGFNEALHERRNRFRHLVDEVLEDGVIDERERLELKEVQEELGLSEHEAATILKAGYRKLAGDAVVCEKCGHETLIRPDTVVSGDGGPRHPGGKPRMGKFG